MIKYIAHKYECMMSDVGLVDIETTNINNRIGIVDITYENTVFKTDERIYYRCIFPTYESVRITLEDCEMNDSIENLPEMKCTVEVFGNVVYFEESSWIERYKESSISDKFQNHGIVPKHYQIIGSEDIVEVLSFDEPVFVKLKETS